MAGGKTEANNKCGPIGKTKWKRWWWYTHTHAHIIRLRDFKLALSVGQHVSVVGKSVTE